MSRLATIGDSNGTYAAYKYLGAGTPVVEDFVGPQVKLDYSADNFSSFDRLPAMTATCLLPKPRPASPALLSGNSRLEKFFLDASTWQVEPHVSRGGLLGSDGASLKRSVDAFVDPIESDPNLYRYCHNRPMNATDPTGMAAQPPWIEIDDFTVPKWEAGQKETVKGNNGTWELTEWRVRRIKTNFSPGPNLQFYGGAVEGKFTIDPKVAKALKVKEYEVLTAVSFTDQGGRPISSLYNYELVDSANTFQPRSAIREQGSIDMSGDASNGRPASMGIRWETVSDKAEIEFLIGARCTKTKNWLGAISVTINVSWHYTDYILGFIPDHYVFEVTMSTSAELDPKQIGAWIDAAYTEKKKRS